MKSTAINAICETQRRFVKIGRMLNDAIHERWSFLTLKGKFPSEAAEDLLINHNLNVGTVTDTIEIYWPLNIINKMPNKQEAELWVATVCITDEMLRLSVLRNKWCYENTLSDPNSLDMFYTILSTHINDVYEIIPESLQIPQAADEPTLLELDAQKMLKAYNLTAAAPYNLTASSGLRILKWD